VLATEGRVASEIARSLLMSKPQGQLAVVRRALPEKRAAISVIEQALTALDAAESLKAALALEAKAAAAYWGAWHKVQMRFARADEARIPRHWSVFAERQSPLSTSPRKAVTSRGNAQTTCMRWRNPNVALRFWPWDWIQVSAGYTETLPTGTAPCSICLNLCVRL
jgi:hypothetical protein